MFCAEEKTLFVLIRHRRDDFCCLFTTGDLKCWENTPGTDPRIPKWVDIGTVKTGEGHPRETVIVILTTY